MNNSAVDVRLWVDPQRLTQRQFDFLQAIALDCPSQNLIISDLRAIREYTDESLFQMEEDEPKWRDRQNSLIWRQVDTARLLVCLCMLEDHDRVFYADMDITNLHINSDPIKSAVSKHGIVLSAGTIKGVKGNFMGWIENQMFGFDERRRDFVTRLYAKTLRQATDDRVNGFIAFKHSIYFQIAQGMGGTAGEICFEPEYLGVAAYQPYPSLNGGPSYKNLALSPHLG